MVHCTKAGKKALLADLPVPIHKALSRILRIAWWRSKILSKIKGEKKYPLFKFQEKLRAQSAWSGTEAALDFLLLEYNTNTHNVKKERSDLAHSPGRLSQWSSDSKAGMSWHKGGRLMTSLQLGTAR